MRQHEGMELRRGDGSVIRVEVVGERDAAPVLFCHGLADSRLSACWFGPAAAELGLRLIAPDRPGTGGSDPHRLSRVADWVEDARLVLDALRVDAVALLGVSGGGPFAAACAAALDGRVRGLTLVSPLGPPGWPTHGMAPGERLSLVLAGLPDIDNRALGQPGTRESFLLNYTEAFRRGSWGVAQDLRVLTRPWGYDLGSISVPATIHHGDADTTVPLQHARLFAEAIPGARLQIHHGQGHFSILAAARELLATPTG